MSLFGKKTQATSSIRYNGISVNQSIYGNAVPLVYGTSRIPLQLIDYQDFKAVDSKQGSGKGGTPSIKSSNYFATIVGLLCEGPIQGVNEVFKSQTAQTLTQLNLQLFLGTGLQSPWQYMVNNHPTHALPYDHMAYVGGANFDLGGSAGVPNLSFEVVGLLASATYGGDAEASQIWVDYCTDPNHGCNFPYLASLTGANSYQAYCIATGLGFISPQETTQRAAQSFLDELLKITNSAPVFTPGVGLRIVPYGDQAVTNGVITWTPNLTPIYAFTDQDYVIKKGAPPVQVEIVPADQTYNVWTVEYLNRAFSYNVDTETYRDEQDIAINGERPAPSVNLHQITTAAVAQQVATLLCQRNLYIRRKFTFSVRVDFSLLEPMDFVSITDTSQGISNVLVRIIETTDDANDNFQIVAEEMLVGPAAAPLYDTELAQGTVANYNADPGNVNTPYIFTAPPPLATLGNGYELWIAVNGASGYWDRADIYASLDNVTYDHVGIKSGPSRYGQLVNGLPQVSDPDTSSRVTVQFLGPSPIQINPATRAAADSFRSLAIVDGEIISYQDVTPLGNNQFTFDYLRRGLYGGAPAQHGIGSSFAILDDAIFRLPFDPGMSGLPVWLKFVSSNYYGGGTQDIAQVPVFQAFFQGQNGGQLLPNGATPLVATGNVVNVGTRLIKTAGVAAWDSQCYSIDAFVVGCALQFRPMRTDKLFAIGLNTDPLTDASFDTIDFCWYVASDGNAYIYESGVLVYSTGPYDTNTVFRIQWDGKYVTYLRNGTLWRRVPYSQVTGPLYFDSAFYDVNAGADNVTFGALNPANPTAWGAIYATVGNEVAVGVSPPASGGYGRIFSLEGFATAHVQFKSTTPASDQLYIGLTSGANVTELSDVNRAPAVDYCWVLTGSSLQLQTQSGGAFTSYGTNQYDATTKFAVTYDGTNVVWLKNGVAVRTESHPGLTVYGGGILYGQSGINSLEYGPGTALKLVDTSGLGANASGTVSAANSAAMVTSNGVVNTGVDLDIISITVTTTGQPVAIDAGAGVYAFTTGTGCVFTTMNLQVYRDGVAVPGMKWDPTNGGTINISGTNYLKGEQVTLSVTDTPAAGTHTYTLHLKQLMTFPSSGSGAVQCSNNLIKVREYKR